MRDQIDNQLRTLEETLVRGAERASEGPTTMRKSRFVSELERRSFVEAYGQTAYDALRE